MRRASITVGNKSLRILWNVVWVIFYRPSPRPFHMWRRFILRCFGAKIEAETYPYPRAKIWAPWNLTMMRGSCIADDVDCYCVDKVLIGERATVSQYTFLCTASHEYRSKGMLLVTDSITIGADAWITSRAFIGPGVRIGDGAIVAACSVVVRDVPDWTIVGGNPARHIKNRPVLVDT